MKRFGNYRKKFGYLTGLVILLATVISAVQSTTATQLAGTTTLVSVAWQGNAGIFPSMKPTISADGRYVAFTSLYSMSGNITGTLNETLQYDMYDTGTNYVVDPIPVSTVALPLGDFYLITVSGTFSFWEVVEWGSVCAGTPEPLPQTLSPGIQNGPVGVDVEYIFAHPCFMYNGVTLPLNIINFEISIDNQQTWFDPVPINSGYWSSHVYRYIVPSEGYPIAFRESDYPTIDNYGVLTIQISRLQLQQRVFLPIIQR